MAQLRFNSTTRIEDNEQVIDTLLRKGWVLIPDAPAYDATIEKIEYNEDTNSYSIVPLTDTSILALKQAEDLIQQYNTFSNAINAGFLVTPENYTLALGEQDRILFSQMLVLVREALSLGMIDDNTIQHIADVNGNRYDVTTRRFREIMVSYGLYYKNLWDSLPH